MNKSRKIRAQSGGLIMNIGIGIVLGLLAALLAVFLVLKGGPFKERAKANVLEQTGQSTDPNTPLYGPNVPPISAGAPITALPGDGLGALTSSGDTKANTSATVETAKPVATPSADPVAAIIESSSKPKADVGKTEPPKDMQQSGVTKVEPTKPEPAKPTVTPKEVKPTVAPTPVPVPSNNATSGKYTIQAGAFNSASEATELKNKLTAQGQAATVTEKKTKDGVLYRVRVGIYASDKEAQAARSKVGGVVLEMNK